MSETSRSSHESLHIPRRLALAIALGVTGVLGTYVAAGQTAEHSPLVMPLKAQELPWANDQVRPFLVRKDETNFARCGTIHTFLGKLYDSARLSTSETVDVTSYIEQYKTARGKHEPAANVLRKELLGSRTQNMVVYCQASPETPVVYLP